MSEMTQKDTMPEDIEHQLRCALDDFKLSQQQCRHQEDKISELTKEIARLKIDYARKEKSSSEILRLVKQMHLALIRADGYMSVVDPNTMTAIEIKKVLAANNVSRIAELMK